MKVDHMASVTPSQRFFQFFQPQPQAGHQHCSDHVRRDLTIRSTQVCHASTSTFLSVDEALRIISDQTLSPFAVNTPVTTSIIGSVIAEDVYAETMVPSCHVSAVDGYAIALEEGKSSKGTFPIVFATGTGTSSLGPLQLGTVMRTTIGARLPPNANAVIKEEDTTVEGMERKYITATTDNIVIGNNIRDPGSYIAGGSRIFARGDALTPLSGAVGLLAMAGVQNVRIFKKPRVGLLSMSDGDAENISRVQNANRLGVLSSLISRGFEIEDLGTVRATMHSELKHAMRFGVDLILLIHGASRNELDLYGVIETLGGFIHFDRVPMKPSSHITFATTPSSDENGVPQSPSIPIFSLPSDPASALVAFNLFVLPSLNKMSGLNERLSTVGVRPRKRSKFGLPRVAVVLTHHIPLDPKRTEYHLAIVTASLSDARLYATGISTEARGVQDTVGSSRMEANALIVLRAGRGVCLKGEIVEALLMGPCSGSDTRLIC
jgi:gephyrin